MAGAAEDDRVTRPAPVTRRRRPVKAIQFNRDMLIDGARRVRAGEVVPAADLPADHVAGVLRLGYATETTLPDPKPADKPTAKKVTP